MIAMGSYCYNFLEEYFLFPNIQKSSPSIYLPVVYTAIAQFFSKSSTGDPLIETHCVRWANFSTPTGGQCG